MVSGSKSGSGGVIVMVGTGVEGWIRTWYIIPLVLVRASGGGVHGSGMNISGLYLVLVVLTITNLCSVSLCIFLE